MSLNFSIDKLGQWQQLDEEGRRDWLLAASEKFFSDESPPNMKKGRTIVLDGRLIDSLVGFYCAIGEAVNGPSGYFGLSMQALDDCFFGKFGLESPFEIIWEHSYVSKLALDEKELLKFLDDEIDINELRSEEGDEGLKWYLETKAAAELCERTMFDEIVESIKSVRQRTSRRIDLTLILK